jgi:hypothetical protein
MKLRDMMLKIFTATHNTEDWVNIKLEELHQDKPKKGRNLITYALKLKIAKEILGLHGR